jgi:diguanylate cyclase (GGDEF)-like protein/PAS domain S-box-containing protein
MKAISYPKISLKTAILIPLALVLMVLFVGAMSVYIDHENQYSEEHIRTMFSSASRIFDSIVKSDSDTLSAALEVITRDDALRRDMLAYDRDSLLRRAGPIFKQLREQYGITHFYFTGPDRVNLLRVHQPDRYGDTIGRVTTARAKASGEPAAGLELGPLGTFTLRVVFPWYVGDRLIGFVELGEEIEHLLQRIKDISGVDLYVAIDKQYLTQKNWVAGMRMLGRHGEWDFLRNSVITFQTTDATSAAIHDLLSGSSHYGQALTEISTHGQLFQTQVMPLRDVGDRKVGNMLLLQNITDRIDHIHYDILFSGTITLVFGGGLVGIFYLITVRVEKRLESSKTELMGSEQRFRSLVESSSDWVWEVDIHGVYTYASPKILELLGYTPEEVVGRMPFDLMPPEEAQRVGEIFKAVVASRQPCYGIENINRHKDGHLVVLETNAVPIFNASGVCVGFRGMDRDITERKMVEQTLRQSETSLAEAQRIAKLGSWDWDLVRQTVYWSDEAYRIFGVPPSQADVTYEVFIETVHPDDRASVQHAVDKALQQRKPYDIEHRIVHPDGRVRVIHARGEVSFDGNNGNPLRFVGTVLDVTEQKATEIQLRQAAKVFENTSEGVIITDPGQRIVAVNQAFTRITGYSEDEAKGQKPKLLRSGRHDDDFYRQMWKVIKTTGRWQGEIWNRRKDGVEYPGWLNISEVRDETDEIVNYIGVFADITAIKEAQEKLEHTAHHDALTGLPNRILFRDRLEQGMAAVRRSGKGLALLFIDLDRFKLVNDTLGHDAGDLMLQEVTRRLVGCLREEDTVARMGGDEFVVILNGIAQPEDAALLASRLLVVVGHPLTLAGHEVVPGLSIGISLYPQNGEEVDILLKNADAAMYRAKEKGRNCYQYYSNEMTEAGMDRLELESDLRQALEHGELMLHYQPQVDLAEGKIIGVEALIRWQHPSRGIISPAVFIPLAEDIGLIGLIGEWVLNTACAAAKAWQAAGLPFLRIAVNVSGRQISNDNVVDMVAAALQRSGLAPQFLEVEVTESVVMKDAARAISTLNALKELGISLAIDDFGTGYSSLSYLKRFPINKLKIDKTFVDGLPNEPDDAAIALAIIAMAHSLRLTVIAEGVETEAQLAFLLARGCDEIQGYFFSKPLPEEQFVELLGSTQSFVLPTME